MGFLDDYEPVADRIEKYWTEYEQGAIITDLITHTDTAVTFKATVYDGERVVATGWAAETITDRGVNATSALENCETSAIGRALANLGFAAKKQRPSREEMTKTRPPETTKARPLEAVPDGGVELTPKQAQTKIKQALRTRFPDWTPTKLDDQSGILYRSALKAMEFTAPTPGNIDQIVGASLDLAEQALR